MIIYHLKEQKTFILFFKGFFPLLCAFHQVKLEIKVVLAHPAAS
jgi:hypothetical protein